MEKVIDYITFFSFHIFVFKIFGFWKPDAAMKHKSLYNLYTAFCTIIWILFLLSQFIYMYKNLDNVKELTAVSYLAGPFIVDLIKMLVIYRKMDTIKLLMINLNQPMFQPKCEEHLKVANAVKKFHRHFFYLCLYLGIQTYLFFLILPFLRDEKMTPTQGWFPFDWRQSPNYEIIYIFQNCVVLWNTIICLNLDTFSSGLLMQIGLQCDYLSITLNNLEIFYVKDGVLLLDDGIIFHNSKLSDIMMENLVVCIRHHQYIKRLAGDIEDIHKTSVLILFLGGGIIICSGLFQLSTAKIGSIESFMLVSYTICMLTEQFMYCWFGNEVIQKSGHIFNCAFNTPWRNCDLQFKKILLQFMTLTKTPIRIRVGGVLVISNAVFVSVVKSSYSIFTLLQKIQE